MPTDNEALRQKITLEWFKQTMGRAFDAIDAIDGKRRTWISAGNATTDATNEGYNAGLCEAENTIAEVLKQEGFSLERETDNAGGVTP
jgi:hypothetical protein